MFVDNSDGHFLTVEMSRARGKGRSEVIFELLLGVLFRTVDVHQVVPQNGFR